MYAIHVPIINGAMRASLNTFKRGVMFAILSARVQFPRVPDQCEELAKVGAKAKCLWGHKYGAYVYLEEHGAALWHGVCNERDSEQALYLLTRIPGLGIVKAAFILQMLGHDIACLDVRNIIRDSRDPRAYRSDAREKASPAWRKKIARYVETTRGKAEHYWDTWCEEVAKDYGSTAEHISRDHVNAIVRKGLRDRPEPVMKDQAIPF
jgi:hypothetical protein